MNRVFLISDTHFGHSKILGFEGDARPFKTIEEHDQRLMELWNENVKPKDTVWHLGDVGFGEGFFSILPKLHGLKKLVMGNHDRYPASRYLEHFAGTYGAVKLHDYIMTHVPIHDSQFYRFKGNIHGHLHSKSLDDKRYINVSAEVIGLKPILFDEAVFSPQPTMPQPETDCPKLSPEAQSAYDKENKEVYNYYSKQYGWDAYDQVLRDEFDEGAK